MVEKIYFKDLKTGTGIFSLRNYFGVVRLNEEYYQVTTKDFRRNYDTLEEVLQLVRYEIDRLYTVTESWTTEIYMEWLKEIELDISKISA